MAGFSFGKPRGNGGATEAAQEPGDDGRGHGVEWRVSSRNLLIL